MQRSSSATPSIFVNGQRYALMEDYRFPVHQYFAAGTVIYDPQLQPPQVIPLCTAPEERGVTVRKLLPNADYHAYLLDPASGTLFSPPTTYTCLYVTNLPSHTTPEMLGRFFEAFDMVKEADVYPGQRTACNGRGWVILQDASKLLLVPRVMEFLPNHLIYAELSDRLPVRRPAPSLPLPTASQAESKSAAAGVGRTAHGAAPPRHVSAAAVDPVVPLSALSSQSPSSAVNAIAVPPPRSSVTAAAANAGDGLLQDRRVTSHGYAVTSIAGRKPSTTTTTTPAPRSASLQSSPPAAATAVSLRCFVMYVTESDAAAAVHEGVFWPSPPLQSRLARIAEANESQTRTASTTSAGQGIVVHIFFMMRAREATVLFGVSRVLLDVAWPQEHGGGYQIEWLAHHLALREGALSYIAGASILYKLPDGAAVRSEVGEAITRAALRASTTRGSLTTLPPSASTHSLHHGGNRASPAAVATPSLPPYPADYPARGRGMPAKVPAVAPPPPAPNGGARAAPRSIGRGRGGSAASPLPPPPPLAEAASSVSNRPPAMLAAGSSSHRGCGGGPAIPKPASRQRRQSQTCPPQESVTTPPAGGCPSPSRTADDSSRNKGDAAVGITNKDLALPNEAAPTQVSS